MLIRSAQISDLEAIMQIQAEAYGADLIESRSCMAQRLSQPDNLNLLAELNGQAAAYLFMYCSTPGKITPFNGAFIPCAADAQTKTLYLHDLAVNQRGRGHGLAKQLLQQARQRAALLHCNSMSLVAVQDALPFWKKNGFRQVTLTDPAQHRQLAGYAENACFCVADIT